MPTALFSDRPENWDRYRAPLLAAFAEKGVAVDLLRETDAPELVDYVIYSPNGGLQDFSRFPNLKAVLSLWAGVEKIEGNPTIRAPLCRMVDDGLTMGMVEWVTGHILRHHLGMDAHICGQNGVWGNGSVPPLARNRKVGFLGLGALGAACAQAAAGLNFDVAGWSRTPKTLDGVATFAGPSGLETVLERSDILVLLLPDTAATRDILDADAFARMPRGAVVINPGRGPLIDDDALLAALDSGQISHATLDVFRQEPLPADHPFWAHPAVTVTPHIASETRPESAARAIAENIWRGETGQPFVHVVDRKAGY